MNRAPEPADPSPDAERELPATPSVETIPPPEVREKSNPGTGFLAVLQSVGAAALGVQSRKNKERDFQQGNPMHFVIGGLIGTLVFIGGVWALVQYLITTSG